MATCLDAIRDRALDVMSKCEPAINSLTEFATVLEAQMPSGTVIGTSTHATRNTGSVDGFAAQPASAGRATVRKRPLKSPSIETQLRKSAATRFLASTKKPRSQWLRGFAFGG